MGQEKGVGMNDELPMEIPEVLSPRLQWMRDHRVKLERRAAKEHDYTNSGTPEQWWTAVAYIEGGGGSGYSVKTLTECNGLTETEALQKLATNQGWKLWNQ